ncbi:MAG: sulfatase [Bdellovibrionaceae bacterium]|nr:sulfatase [Pseudobdellovibrionaceae bacterium]
MNNKYISTLCFLCIALIAVTCQQAADQPNIIFIVADDMGYADCGVQGCTDFPTPCLDALANEGVRFTDGYVTGSVCSPSRAALMTGRYQQRDGVVDWVRPDTKGGLNPGVPTVADYLRKAGYRTAMFGKWHLGERDALSPVSRGFDEFFGFLGGARSYYPDEPTDDAAKEDRYQRLVRGRDPVVETEYTTYAFGREAVDFIKRQQGGSQPFFLYLAFNAVHTPMHAPADDADRFAEIPDGRRRTYARMLAAMDRTIGKVLDAVRETGAEENTLICFISDNGGPITRNAPNKSSNEPLRGGKGEAWEGGIRVPFFVKWTGRLQAGSVFREPVTQMDLTATALALAGVEAAAEWPMDGLDLMPILTGKQDMPQRTLYWYVPTNAKQWAIRRGNWKLTTALPEKVKTTVTGLYDLGSDIGESNDLTASHPGLAKELQAEWEAWHAEVMPDQAAHSQIPSSSSAEGEFNH